MNKEFIPYEQALAIKELGFDEGYYLARYIDAAILIPREEEYDWSWDLTKSAKAPLYQQAFRWFREKYELYSFISKEHLGFTYALLDGTYGFHIISFDTYEEAEIACLKKLIELVKNKQS